MKAIIVEGTAKEVIALVRETQGRSRTEQLVMIRKPYSTEYTLVRLGKKKKDHLEAK